MYLMQIKIKDEWKSIHPGGTDRPYKYKTKEEAEKMLRICYPFLIHNEERRVKEETDEN